MLLLVGVFGQPEDEPGAATTPSVAPPSAQPPVPPPTPPPATATSTPTPTPTPTLPTEPPDIPVVVLNSIGESGLASRVTDYLAELGYDMGGPDDYLPPLEFTTVYYPEGFEADARALAALAPGSGTTVTPVTLEVSAEALTVILGEDAAGWTAPEAPATEPASPST